MEWNMQRICALSRFITKRILPLHPSQWWNIISQWTFIKTTMQKSGHPLPSSLTKIISLQKLKSLPFYNLNIKKLENITIISLKSSKTTLLLNLPHLRLQQTHPLLPERSQQLSISTDQKYLRTNLNQKVTYHRNIFSLCWNLWKNWGMWTGNRRMLSIWLL